MRMSYSGTGANNEFWGARWDGYWRVERRPYHNMTVDVTSCIVQACVEVPCKSWNMKLDKQHASTRCSFK